MNLKDKADVSRLFRLGAFGNKLHTWECPQDVPFKFQFEHILFGLRYNQPGGPFLYPLTWQQVMEQWTPSYYICEGIGHNDLLFNAEIMRGINGYELQVSYAATTLRDAFSNQNFCRSIYRVPEHENKITAILFLKEKMTQYSYIELMDCLNLSPDAIVEFSVFNRDVGERPGRNTIIWEVREY